MYQPLIALLGTFVLATIPPAFGADHARIDWPEFRGVNGDGVGVDCRPPVSMDADNLVWRVPCPTGFSSPILIDQLVCLTAIDDNRLVTLAVSRRDGQTVWRAAAPQVPIEHVHETSNPAAPTPCADRNGIYVYFGSFGLLAYDLDGKLRWQRRLSTPRSPYGTATSPIVHQDRLYLVRDTDAKIPDSKLFQSELIALACATGNTVWQTARPLQRSGWSTPTVWEHDGGAELVVLGSGRLSGYDLATGSERWFVNGFSRETVARPITDGRFVFGAASMLGGVPDEQPDPEPFWTAVMRFDANHDGKLQHGEMTGPFTFPFRPELPADHPGFGLPLPADPDQRQRRLDGMFAHIDKNRDGSWSKDEFLRNLSFNRAKPTLVKVRSGGRGDVTESHAVWMLHRSIPEVPSPVLYQQRIYLVQDGGILSCVDVRTGSIVYRKRLGPRGHYRASPVVANDHLYTVSEQGVLSVVRTGDTFQVVHQHDFHERVAATPALDQTTVYVRTTKTLYAFRQ